VGVAELSAGRVAWARDAEAMIVVTIVTFYFNLESLVKHWLLIVGDVRRCYPSFNSRS